MTRNFILTLAIIMLGTCAFAQTAISGKVTDTDSGEELIGANIVLKKGGVYVTGASTDFDGNYKLDIDPGTYDVECTYIGYPDNLITGVVAKSGQENKLDIKLGGGGDGVLLDEVIVIEYKAPLIEIDNTSSGGVVTAEQIRNLPTKDINALAAQTAGLASADEGEGVTVRGSREASTVYFLDGVRVSGNMIPQSEVDQLQVITGGIAAQYGDVTGGIISITSKGPSSQYSGGLEVETTQFLDNFGYNLVSGNISGPILKKKSGESILGFRISGQYIYQKDDDPTAVPITVVKADKLAELEARPLLPVGQSLTLAPAADFLLEDDTEKLDYRPNEEATRFDITAKLDARLSKNIDITLSGNFNSDKDRFTPGLGNQTGSTWSLLNSHNNPMLDDYRYRGNFRFRHRLGATEDTEGEEKKNSAIRNTSYTLQFGYERFARSLTDHNHGNDLFNYGYVGSFENTFIPSVLVEFNPDSPDGFDIMHTDYQEVFQGYTPSTEINPVLANYNAGLDFNDPLQYPVLNGFTSTNFTESRALHDNVGWVYNLARKQQNEVYTVNANAKFDLVPGGSDESTHSIQFGFLFEQRVERRHDVSPFGLYNSARQRENLHLSGLNTNNQIGTFEVPHPNPLLGTTITVDQYEAFLSPGLVEEGHFYKEIRKLTGQGLTEFTNVDAITPDQLSLDMFSATELNNDDRLEYYGYDYLGNELPTSTTFDDFFRSTYERDGVTYRAFDVAPNMPVYAAGYIQDKFKFKDIIFRLGVRLDRYDANTKVLKDEYSLYEIMGANDFFANPDVTAERPATIEDDYKVYVTGEGSTTPIGFRDGDQWYFPNGTAANSGVLVFGGTTVNPVYKFENAEIKNPDFQTEYSFEDYKPQINVMPRLAFSFPISDVANFFAHYDILTQRPPGNNIATPLDYYYFDERRKGTNTTPLNNPNLKPEKTIDYEVGFQQKLTNSSAIKLAAYYKEMRDMIQRTTILFVPGITDYITYANVDFGTVKGFSFQYDLRRTGNISLLANYTLQFADGTGSNANSQQGLTSRGNLRTLFPLSFDERHRIVASIDYRYGSGKKYNGPRLFGKNIFASAGANIQMTAVSGRPYTANLNPEPLTGSIVIGALNGARKPWNYTLNLRLDKNFNLSKPDAKKPLNLNVYFRVQNLLNRKNVINVYPATASAYDDGYLNSPNGQSAIAASLNPEAFQFSHQTRMLNPDFFSRPRRIYLGAIIEF